MALLVNNAHIRCTTCGYGPFAGRESEQRNRDGSLYVECRWICPRCTSMVRLDEKTIPAEKK